MEITILNVFGSPLQDVFDKIATHLLTQNATALNSYDDCVYLADDGKRCAMGCLIPEGCYEPNFEGDSLGSIIVHFYNATYNPPHKHYHLLQELQNLHDNIPVDHWAHRLHQVALNFNLNAEVIQRCKPS